MGVKWYKTEKGRVFWAVDVTVTLVDGRVERFRRFRIPSKDVAFKVEKDAIARFLSMGFIKVPRSELMTVSDAWEIYKPYGMTKRSWRTDRRRADDMLRLLGKKIVTHMLDADIFRYRDTRNKEHTRCGRPPASSTVDREVELLFRSINYCVKQRKLGMNPFTRKGILNKDNVRNKFIGEKDFLKLYQAADPFFRPIILTAFDTGMRRNEVLGLRWDQLDLKKREIRLEARDTKTRKPRIIRLTSRVVAVIESQPRHIHSPFVFVNPQTQNRWDEIRKMWRRACKGAGLEGLWFHDLRRSFVTNARKRGVPESVVMKMSGHRTRSVFDRYNIVDEEDLEEAVSVIEKGARDELKNEGIVADFAELMGL